VKQQRRTSWQRHRRRTALLVATALVATACGGDGDGGGDAVAGGPDALDCGDIPDQGDLEGATINIFGAFTSTDADGVNRVIEECFNEPFNADANYEGSDSFEEQIQVRVEGGNPPDLALFPQPGAVLAQAEQGAALSIEDLGYDVAEFEDVYGDYLMTLGERDGRHYGIPASVNFKSLVWHNLPVFEAEGYEVPSTWDELLALSEQAVEDGYTPWCIGSGSDAATGWVATDWMEDIMLRTAGPDLYDQWVANDIPFDHESVRTAAETFAQIAFEPDFIVGNPAEIPAIDFRDAVDGLVSPSPDEPTCLLHRQATFITAFFPEGTEIGVDVDVFPFPEIDPDLPPAALIAGDYLAVYADRPEVRAFVDVFTSVGFQCATGGIEGVSRISPHVETSPDCYRDEVLATSAGTIVDAVREGGARFDASDLMPPQIGSGLFWSGMNDWMGGADLDDTLARIEAGWPSS
jgi:alpha-glucoside transport system substrate-binding protein